MFFVFYYFLFLYVRYSTLVYKILTFDLLTMVTNHFKLFGSLVAYLRISQKKDFY